MAQAVRRVWPSISAPKALEAYVQGSVGWVADRPVLVLPDGDEIPMRITVVFHLVRGHWKFVQMHLSSGIGNEPLLGTTLTTALESLVTYAEAVRPDLAEAAAPDGTVTVVFTDIEGSTEMAERMGDHWMDLLTGTTGWYGSRRHSSAGSW